MYKLITSETSYIARQGITNTYAITEVPWTEEELEKLTDRVAENSPSYQAAEAYWLELLIEQGLITSERLTEAHQKRLVDESPHIRRQTETWLMNGYTEKPDGSRGLKVELIYEQQGGHNWDQRPDRLLIRVDGGEKTEIDLFGCLPDASMTVEDALLTYGPQDGPARLKICRELVQKIAANRQARLADFLSLPSR